MSFTSAEPRWADVYLLAAGRGISVCGDLLATFALALVLQEVGHGGLAVSGLLLASTLPIAVLAPVAGRLADRADSRTLLVLVGLAQAAVCVALAFSTHPVLVVALVATLAAGLAITQPTIAALIPRMVPRADLPRASGIVASAGQIGMLIGPALAGILVGQTGQRLPLLLDAVSYLGLVAVGLLVRTRRRAGTADVSVRAAFRLRDDRTLTVMTIAVAAVVAGVSAINVFDVFFVRETLGASTTLYGLVAAAWTAGMLLGSPLGGRIPEHRRTVGTVLFLLAGACLAILIGGLTARSAWWLVPLWIVGGVCNGALNVSTSVLIANRVRPEAHGRAFSIFGASVQAAGILGFFVAGPLVESFDPRVLVAGAGAAGLVAALACLPLVRFQPRAAPATSMRDEIGDNVAA
ncbi:MFS transporter [Actinoplanes xinjiangensis]|uniref:MFS transporter n=1 Tax=Actinoplanes xinjiangensis TaxID=512350 RepID=UPI00343CC3DF